VDAGLAIASLPNLRDIGGSGVRGGGRVRTGLLFRSTALDRLDDAGIRIVGGLGIRTVFDLRTADERRMRPDRLPPTAAAVPLDMLRDSSRPGPAELMGLFADPVAATEEFGGGRGIAMFEATYREFVTLGSARAALGHLLRDLARPEVRPALLHCTTGKDRTGWAVAVFQLSLGVPFDVVMQEFLRSNESLLPAFEPEAQRFAAAGGDPEVVRALIRVYPAYLEVALEEARRVHGSIDGYIADGLGVDDDVLGELRATFVGPAA
jgi:protein-tyrosine phosphatase